MSPIQKTIIGIIIGVFTTVASAAIVGWGAFIFNNTLATRDGVQDMKTETAAIRKVLVEEVAAGQEAFKDLTAKVEELETQLEITQQESYEFQQSLLQLLATADADIPLDSFFPAPAAGGAMQQSETTTEPVRPQPQQRVSEERIYERLNQERERLGTK